MPKGTYTLVIELPRSTAIEVGSLGTIAFPRGWYAYTGSAFGPGGFARVERHRAVAAGEREVRHWHVDYLLGHSDTRIGAVVRSAGVDAECAIGRRIDGEPIPRFGASDCDCDTHLVYAERRRDLERAVGRAHDGAGTVD